MGSERERTALLAAILGRPRDGVTLGIGDDAAILAPVTEPLVWTIDAAVEGVHFRRDLLSLHDLGYRATMAAASDLAAMGARPLGLLAALVLPEALSDADLAELAAGQREAAEALGTTLVGGNLARGGELSVTTTALGLCARPLRRDGALEGDELWLAGPVGLAAAGLALLLAAPLRPPAGGVAGRAIAAWRRPRARLEAGLEAAARAHAAIDVSDGLAQDAGHLARASGLRAVLDAESLSSADLDAVSSLVGRAALDLALRGGEDYALLAAMPPGQAPSGFVRVGGCERRAEGASAVALRHAGGALEPLEERGFDHFSR